MPADRAKGRFATRPMTSVAMAEVMAVAANTLPKSMPEADRIPGLTANM